MTEDIKYKYHRLHVIMKTIKKDFKQEQRYILKPDVTNWATLTLLVVVLTRQDIKIAIMGGPSNLKTLLWLEHKIDFNWLLQHSYGTTYITNIYSYEVFFSYFARFDDILHGITRFYIILKCSVRWREILSIIFCTFMAAVWPAIFQLRADNLFMVIFDFDRCQSNQPRSDPKVARDRWSDLKNNKRH